MSVPLYMAISIFAMSSWIDINGVFTQFPLLVKALPEGWNLPVQLVHIVQVANIAPLLLLLYNKLSRRKITEHVLIYIIVSVGVLSCLMLALFWKKTSVIAGAERSVALLGLCASLAIVDCTSSVVYLPYMDKFPTEYISALYVGRGLSVLLPGVVGIAQGMGRLTCVNATVMDNITGMKIIDMGREFQDILIPVYKQPRFSVDSFFYFIFAMMVFAFVSFSFVHYGIGRKWQKRSRMANICQEEEGRVHGFEMTTVTVTEDGDYEKTGTQMIDRPTQQRETGEFNKPDDDDGDDYAIVVNNLMEEANVKNGDVPLQKTYSGRSIVLLSVTMVANALANTILPSVLPYATLPYSDRAYSLSVRLAAIIHPVFCFLTLFIRYASPLILTLLTCLAGVLSSYLIGLAVMSPTPPLMAHVTGEIIVVRITLLCKTENRNCLLEKYVVASF